MKESYATLATRFKTDGDEKTFTKLYNKMRPGLRNYIYGFVKDNDITEDLLSDTFSKVYNQIEKFDPTKGQITTWTFKIAKNNCLAHINQSKKTMSLDYFLDKGINPSSRFSVDLSYELDDVKSTDELVKDDNKLETMYQMSIEYIKDLPELYSEIIQDRLINNMDYKSIMYKHDEKFSKVQQDYDNNKITEKIYNKEHKRALQRVKNKIKRGKFKLSKLIMENINKMEF